MRWRARTVVGEGVRNLSASLAGVVAPALALGLALGGLAYAEASFARDLAAFESEFRLRGGYVAQVRARDSGLSMARCASLAHRPGVVAAGGVHLLASTQFSQAPGLAFRMVAISRGVPAIWDPAAGTAGSDPGFLLGADLANAYALVPGQWVATPDAGLVPVSGVLDTGLRNPAAGRWAMVMAAPAGPADECWVEFTPGAFPAGIESLAATFADASPEARVEPWRRRDEFTRDPGRELRSRPLRRAGPLVGLFLGVAMWVPAWLRRSEAGLYRALGMSRGQVLLLRQVETAVVVGFALAGGFAWAMAVLGAQEGAFPPSDQVLLSLRSVAGAAAVALIVAPIGVLLAGRGGVGELLKDR